MPKNLAVAICYDWLDSFGGAERLIQVLLEQYPTAEIYSLVANPRINWLGQHKVHTSWLSKLPVLKRRRWVMALLSIWLWKRFDLKDFDLVISVTSDQAKALRHHRQLCICLSPPRHLWTQFYNYTKSGFIAVILRIIGTPLRVVDFYGTQRVGLMVAISSEVQQRILRAYGLRAEVLYPPVGKQ